MESFSERGVGTVFTQMIDLAPLDLRAAVGGVDRDQRIVGLIFSTGAPVARLDWATGKSYLERLSLKAAHVKLDRLNSGAPLLNAHSAYSLADQIGVVEAGSASVNGTEGRARVRFSRRADVQPIWEDVRDGIVRNVSVGYRVYEFEETPGQGRELPVRLATSWEPFEISLTPMGADVGAQIRSAGALLTNRCVIVTGRGGPLDDAERIRRLVAHLDEDRTRRLDAAKARAWF